MPDLTIPLIAATVFTAGGYAILSTKRFADRIGDALVTVFVLCTLAVGVETMKHYAERHSSRPGTVSASAPKAVPPTAPSQMAEPIYWPGD